MRIRSSFPSATAADGAGPTLRGCGPTASRPPHRPRAYASVLGTASARPRPIQSPRPRTYARVHRRRLIPRVRIPGVDSATSSTRPTPTDRPTYPPTFLPQFHAPSPTHPPIHPVADTVELTCAHRSTYTHRLWPTNVNRRPRETKMLTQGRHVDTSPSLSLSLSLSLSASHSLIPLLFGVIILSLYIIFYLFTIYLRIVYFLFSILSK